MAEFTGLVTFKGNPITLVGDAVEVGQQAPAFTAHKSLVEAVTLADFAGKVVVLSIAPSVDTGVCQQQLRAFNEQATGLGDDVVILYASRDLPFALGRFCGAEGIDNVVTLSDWKEREIGDKFGVYMKELGLLARSTFVIGKDGKVLYKEIVPEMIDEPSYDGAIAAVKAAL